MELLESFEISRSGKFLFKNHPAPLLGKGGVIPNIRIKDVMKRRMNGNVLNV
jgi:hypothetical protein